MKQGAGAVKQGVEAGAKLLENLDEVREKNTPAVIFVRGVNNPAFLVGNIAQMSKQVFGCIWLLFVVAPNG